MTEERQYVVGDFVVPIDLPRSFLCFVTNAHDIGVEDDQLLELEPLEGPWPAGTQLVRMDTMVRLATTLEVGRALEESSDRAERLRRPPLAPRLPHAAYQQLLPSPGVA